ncbi:hypothetical protein ACLOJK_020775 [Asimina triloba]
MAMESSTSFLLMSAIFFSALLFYFHRNGSHRSRARPPGPPGWPVVGNMFDLGSIPHQTLAELHKKYGPVLSLRLGSVNTLVILSAEATTELFKNHDLSFAGRSIVEAMRACSYNEGSMALAQYGPYWRLLRRLCTTQLFVNRRLNETITVRKKCVEDMVKSIAEEAQKNSSVDLNTFVYFTVFNLVGKLTLSCNLLDTEMKEGAELARLNAEATELTGKPNVADFFPLLRWFDPQGIRRRMETILRRSMDIAGKFIEDHRKNQRLHKETDQKDLLDVLMGFRGDGKEEPAQLSDRDLKILIVELFMAATDTTTSSIEWAMAELLRSPGSLRKVQEELDQVVGQSRTIEEKHIGQLPYLTAVIKETLRLHPPLPFLVPRRAVKDTEFMGYSIVKDTQVFVHAWAIGRDPACYDDPSSFKPERFLNADVDYRGHHFQLIPFGAGRRMCPGMPLADRTLPLLLGSLLHSFDWALDGNVATEMIDMTERMGITLRMAKPLNVIPKLRMRSIM